MYYCPVCSGKLCGLDEFDYKVCIDCGCSFSDEELGDTEEDDWYAGGEQAGDIARDGG